MAHVPFRRDKISEGNIALILDVLCILGLVECTWEDDEQMYRSAPIENPAAV